MPKDVILHIGLPKTGTTFLQNEIFPKLDGEKVLFGEFTKEKLPMQKLPIACTLYKIGDNVFLDPKTKEEKVIDVRVSIAVSENNEINAMQKGGAIGIDMEEIEKMIDIALEKTKELRKFLP